MVFHLCQYSYAMHQCFMFNIALTVYTEYQARLFDGISYVVIRGTPRFSHRE